VVWGPDLAIAASCIGPEEQARHVPSLIFAFPPVYLFMPGNSKSDREKNKPFFSQAAAKENRKYNKGRGWWRFGLVP
jgi:hypothetical protein